ncbi:MAG: amino acid kinase [Gemmatimonadales bacterium]
MTPRAPVVHTVIKVGGGLLRTAAALERVAAVLADVGGGHRILVVPGGGPFADAVRACSRRIGLGDDAAHWMAILGMDQYAHALAFHIVGSRLVERKPDIAAALGDGRVPVLAPFRWLRATDPLPHSWDVTSDSIAAWIAGAVGARRLVLIKPGRGEPGRLVDPYFPRALTPGIEHLVLAVDDVAALGLALDERVASPEQR